MSFAERRAERKIFHELHHQLKVSYNVQRQTNLPEGCSPETNKIYLTDALKLHFHFDTCVLEVYDISENKLVSIDCMWNACDADQKRRDKAFQKLYHYTIQREREPKKSVESSQYNKRNQFGQKAHVQELYVGLHLIKGAYAMAWYGGKARTY